MPELRTLEFTGDPYLSEIKHQGTMALLNRCPRLEEISFTQRGLLSFIDPQTLPALRVWSTGASIPYLMFLALARRCPRLSRLTAVVTGSSADVSLLQHCIFQELSHVDCRLDSSVLSLLDPIRAPKLNSLLYPDVAVLGSFLSSAPCTSLQSLTLGAPQPIQNADVLSLFHHLPNLTSLTLVEFTSYSGMRLDAFLQAWLVESSPAVRLLPARLARLNILECEFAYAAAPLVNLLIARHEASGTTLPYLNIVQTGDTLSSETEIFPKDLVTMLRAVVETVDIDVDVTSSPRQRMMYAYNRALGVC
ncbi:hypothetical protein EXIGLDRAFT_304606 [Exidia glandulosa HHB12029]|uniref:F-box domain-containing protein n=1 Tax=Exidia glandulosa HHB12029 TaxID=1314781 RepID=A0A165D584_EXIGL|nr:hypothetical protein EXIGLDRAFT_304606 [Exidia glandulosa HHB12029]